jgi:hypothetical protein
MDPGAGSKIGINLAKLVRGLRRLGTKNFSDRSTADKRQPGLGTDWMAGMVLKK